SIGDQSHRIAKSGTDDRRGRRQHLAHPGPALGPFITDHDYVALYDLAREDRLERVLLAVEYPRRPGYLLMLNPGDLRHRALCGEVAAEDRQMALGVHRIIPLVDNFLIVARRFRNLSQRLGDGAAGDGFFTAVQD